jgi:hypothetical protein
VQTDYNSGKLQKPFQARQRFFTNLEFQTHIKEKGKQWKFDYTLNWTGEQNLPNSNEELSSLSPAYVVMNAQITRTFTSTFEMYVGAENFGNYKQEKAIIGSENPFGTNFDTSIVYAPIFGKMFYFGLRFKVK